MQVLLHDFVAMGTVFRFTFAQTDSQRVLELLPKATQLLVEADETFSTYKETSDVSRFNSGSLAMSDVTGDFRYVFEQCEYWRVVTQGAFDPIDPSGNYDPSGFVKAWAAQAAVQFLEANGITNFTLNAGGDILLGTAAAGVLQRVGISHPHSIVERGFTAQKLIDLAGTGYRAVATSGSAERGEHIWGEACSVRQVSVVAQDLITADVWATAIYANGANLLTELENSELEAVVLLKDGREITTSGFTRLEKFHQFHQEG